LVHTQLVAPFQGVAKYTVSTFHPVITRLASKCSEVANNIEIPSIEFMAADLSTNMAIVVGTNCNWQSSCLWDSASLQISIAGKKSKPARVRIWMNGTIVKAELFVERELVSDNGCQLSETKEWIQNVDLVLKLLVQSQREEFQ
jgi:hypothetical protein